MKRISSLALLAAVVLAGCNPTGKFNPTDARTFGLVGDVMEVTQTMMLIDSQDGETVITEDQRVAAFDDAGRVTLDPYQNIYEYDEDGVFTDGGVPETVMVRDAKGRIETYDNTGYDEYEDDDFDVMEYCSLQFTYDAKGRPAQIELGYWEGYQEQSFVYEGNQVYPSSSTIKGGSEGYNEESTETYEYTKFDEKGNWTECVVTLVSKTWEEPWEENVEPEVVTETLKTRRIRNILYWSDVQ